MKTWILLLAGICGFHGANARTSIQSAGTCHRALTLELAPTSSRAVLGPRLASAGGAAVVVENRVGATGNMAPNTSPRRRPRATRCSSPHLFRHQSSAVRALPFDP